MDSVFLNSLYKVQPTSRNAYERSDTINSTGNESESFSSVLDGAIQHLNEVNALQNQASEEMVSFALGESDNMHDMLIAAQKANQALQYTVAIRNQFINGYNTIMQMQI